MNCKIIAVLENTAKRLILHVRGNSTLWISLAVFLLLAWLSTGTSCVVRSITGLPCPGCGLTRALWALLQGDLADAFHWHPLFWLAPLILLTMLGLLIFRPALLHSRQANFVWLFLAVVFILVYVVRMVLYFPNAEPLTYNRLSLFGRIGSLVRLLVQATLD